MSFNFYTILTMTSAIVIAYQIYRFIFLPPAAWTQPSRASAENKLLASWKYTGEEWARYSNTNLKILRNERLKNSRKEMKIEITSKHIIFTTGAISDSVVIDGKCVRTIDCSISGNVLYIVRGVRYPSRVRSRYDKFRKLVFELPIPKGFENEAAQACEYFRVLINEEAENIADLYPDRGWLLNN